jgi:hypothetical protein
MHMNIADHSRDAPKSPTRGKRILWRICVHVCSLNNVDGDMSAKIQTRMR